MLRAGKGLVCFWFLAVAFVLRARAVVVSHYLAALSRGAAHVLRGSVVMRFFPKCKLHVRPPSFARMDSISASTPETVQRMRRLMGSRSSWDAQAGFGVGSSATIIAGSTFRCCYIEHGSIMHVAMFRAAPTRSTASTEHAGCRLQKQARSGRPETSDDGDKTIEDGPLAPSTNGRRDSSPPTIFYFAYGANMSPAILTAKRGVRPLASVPVEAVSLNRQDVEKKTSAGQPQSLAPSRVDNGICLSFCHRSGFATLTPSPGPHQGWEISPGVHGVLHSILPSDMERIEDVETGYRRCEVVVETYEGRQCCAVCFISDPMQVLFTSVPPTIRYLSLLRDGASYHGLNDRYQSWLATVPSVQSEEAETRAERTNTPAKRALNNGLTGIGVLTLLAAVHNCFGSW